LNELPDLHVYALSPSLHSSEVRDPNLLQELRDELPPIAITSLDYSLARDPTFGDRAFSMDEVQRRQNQE
jgi:hypothetical protein